MFKEGRPGYSDLRGAAADITTTIFGHPQFTAWSAGAKKLFTKWRTESAPRLRAIAKGDNPKLFIEELSEALLAAFTKAKLVDPYDVYQHLLDYWSDEMQDDVYLIVADGWRAAAKPRQIVEDKDKKSKEKPDFTVGKLKFKAELLSPALVIARDFAGDEAAIEALESEASAAAQAMGELAEEHGGEEGLLAEARNDKDKLTRASVSSRLKEIKDDNDAADERKLLGEYLALAEKEAGLNAKASAAREALTVKVAARYGKLTEDEIKSLVVDDKWLTALEAAVQGELDRVSQRLAGRVRELADRYATPLPALEREVADWSSRVEQHLARMGFRP